MIAGNEIKTIIVSIYFANNCLWMEYQYLFLDTSKDNQVYVLPLKSSILVSFILAHSLFHQPILLCLCGRLTYRGTYIFTTIIGKSYINAPLNEIGLWSTTFAIQSIVGQKISTQYTQALLVCELLGNMIVI